MAQKARLECPYCLKKSKHTRVSTKAVYCPDCGEPLIKLEIISESEQFLSPSDRPQPVQFRVRNQSIREVTLDCKIEEATGGRNWVQTPQRRSVAKDSVTTIQFIVDATRLTHSVGEATITVFVQDVPKVEEQIFIAAGPPPEPAVEPTDVNIGSVYIGTKKEVTVMLSNSGGGRFTLTDYQGRLIGSRKIDPPAVIGTRATREYPLTVTLDLTQKDQLQVGTLQETVNLQFKETNLQASFTINGELKLGPVLEGTVSWQQVTERRTSGLRSGSESYRYEEDMREVTISPQNMNIPINLGDIPQGVRANVFLRLDNTGQEYLHGTMECQCNIPGIQATFDDLKMSKLDVNMEPLQIQKIRLEIDTRNANVVEEQCRLTAELEYQEQYHLPSLELDISFNLVPCRDYPSYLAADFGTTNSCIAYRGFRAVEPKTVTMGMRTRYQYLVGQGNSGSEDESNPNPYLYSFVCFPEEGNFDDVLVGRVAAELAAADLRVAPRAIRSIKNKLGTSWMKAIDYRQFTAQEIAQFLINELIQKARDQLKMNPVKAIITLPANSPPLKIEEILSMYINAGLTSLTRDDIIYEPEAAAYYYILRNEEIVNQLVEGKPCHLLTFDFGGSTLDVSVVKVQKQDEKIEITVLASRAEPIGGDTIDWALRRFVINQTQKIPSAEKERYTKRFSDLSASLNHLSKEQRSALNSARLELMVECEHAKIYLSHGKSSYTVSIDEFVSDDAGRRIDVTLRPDDLNTVLNESGILQQAMGVIDEVLGSSTNQLNHDEIDYVFMVGGSSYIPLVQEEVKRKFPSRNGKERVFLAEDEAKTCVSLGAVLYGLARSDPNSPYIFSNVQPTTPYRLGLIRMGATMLFEGVFPVGTPYGTQKEPISITMPAAGECRFVFALNKGSKDTVFRNDDIKTLGEDSFTQAPPGDSFNVTYELDQMGQFTALAEYQGQKYPLGVQIVDGYADEAPEDDPGF